MKLTNWSYSRYGTWKKCPAILRFDQTSTKPREVHPAAERGTNVHKIVEDYLLAQGDLPDEFVYYRSFLDGLREQGAIPEQQLAIDKNWNQVEWDDPNRWWRGILDASLLLPDFAVIYDWKTGGEYADHREQREIYAAAYHACHPVKTVQVFHVYFDKKQITHGTFFDHEMEDLRGRWEGRIAPMLADDQLVANPGYYCRTCRHSRWNNGPCKF